VLLGIDLDNTILDYDLSFLAAAKSLKLEFPKSASSKQKIKDHFRAQDNGEEIWQRLQGLAYGKYVQSHVRIYQGVKRFLWRCQNRGHIIKIISHKTEFGHFDSEKLSIRKEALDFLKAKGFINENNPLVKEVCFKNTKEEKIMRICREPFDWFIDDLPEVLEGLNSTTSKKILFDESGEQVSFISDELRQDVFSFPDWQQIDTLINGEWTVEEVIKLAVSILDIKVEAAEKVSNGGNAGVFKLTLSDKRVVKFKIYPVDKNHNRLNSEFLASEVISTLKIGRVPLPIAQDVELGVGIYEWIEGDRLLSATQEYLDSSLNFLRNLHFLRNDPQFLQATNASAACFSLDDIKNQLFKRLDQFQLARIDYPELDKFLLNDFLPVVESGLRFAWSKSISTDLKNIISTENQTLSPSDFGIHNVIVCKDGSYAFIDFEYFGWDDPVKLISDFCFHPGTQLSEEQIEHWVQKAVHIYGDDVKLRLNAFRPIIGLIWCLILLNDFRPEIWQRRILADESKISSKEKTLLSQLHRAKALLTRIKVLINFD
jgi:hypothetical protein